MLVKNYFSKCVPFHVLILSFLSNDFKSIRNCFQAGFYGYTQHIISPLVNRRFVFDKQPRQGGPSLNSGSAPNNIFLLDSSTRLSKVLPSILDVLDAIHANSGILTLNFSLEI